LLKGLKKQGLTSYGQPRPIVGLARFIRDFPDPWKYIRYERRRRWQHRLTDLIVVPVCSAVNESMKRKEKYPRF